MSYPVEQGKGVHGVVGHMEIAEESHVEKVKRVYKILYSFYPK